MKTCIQIFRGQTLLHDLAFETDVIKIGRLRSSHIFLDDDGVARMHAVIEVFETTATMIDLGSSSGVLVNGQRVVKNRRLQDGDRVLCGPFLLVFTFDPKPAFEPEPGPDPTPVVASVPDPPAHVEIIGFQIRELLRRWELRRDTILGVLEDAMTAFPGEEKASPVDATESFLAAERAIAEIQVAQARYNLHVKVPCEGKMITLCEAVKRIGGLGRVSKHWRDAVAPKKRNSWSEDVRHSGEIRATRTVSVMVAQKMAAERDQAAAELRAAIAAGNTTRVSTEDIGLDPSLLYTKD